MKTTQFLFILCLATVLSFSACSSSDDTGAGGSTDGGHQTTSSDGGGQGGNVTRNEAGASMVSGGCLSVLKADGETYCGFYEYIGPAGPNKLNQDKNNCLSPLETSKTNTWVDSCPKENCLGGCQKQVNTADGLNAFTYTNYYYAGKLYTSANQISPICAMATPKEEYVPPPQ